LYVSMLIHTISADAPAYSRLRPLLPGLAFSATVGVFIYLGDRALDNPYFDGLLIALVFGIAVKNLTPSSSWHQAGSKFAGKSLLEFAVMVLGASVFMPDIAESGVGLLALVITGVIGSMALAYFVGHVLLGLSQKLAILVGVGNSICGNSAIAVMAPVIRASPSDVGAAIGISAILGAAQILLLQLLVPVFGLSDYHYGIVAGLAVYAMAQVYSASVVVSEASASVAVVVKLSRVFLLSPMVIVTQIIQKRSGSRDAATGSPGKEDDTVKGGFRLTAVTGFVPWFLIGFAILSALRSFDIIGADLGSQVRDASKPLFTVAMVGIGLGVDLRAIVDVGLKVAVTILAVITFMIALGIIGGSFLNNV
jgi:uncharacterized integral membrane protein (TIGR00698 family)